MSYLDAILLGIVQGVAEFLPISSSGHLVIIEQLMGLGPQPTAGVEGAGHGTDLLALNVALHFGSLLSILVVFRRDLLQVLRDRQLMTAVVIATLPLIPIALLFKDFVDKWSSSPLVAGCGLCLTAVLLLVSQRFEPRERVSMSLNDSGAPAGPPSTAAEHPTSDAVSWRQALVVGLFQAVAITPGVSRSGSTIAASLMQGLPRDVAAKFAFLIAIPAILGASVLEAKDLFGSDMSADLGPIAAGTLVSFIVGVFCLNWLLRLITQRRLHWFGWYCLVVGIAVIAWTARG